MTNQFRVLILGYGEMGHAMQYLLRERHLLDIWEKYPRDEFESVVLEDAAALADIIIFCLPVNPHIEVAERIAPVVKTNCLCLSIAKGLNEAGQTAAEIFSETLPTHQSFALLYGPMISEEIRAGRPAFAQLGCDDMKAYDKVLELFHDTNLRIEHTMDITGISWSVILKNVYAIIFGISDELQLGDNMRGYLAVAALHELDQIVQEMGGSAGSPFHLAGLGDLVTTATSNESHHHELGCLLARGAKTGIEGEGVHTLKVVTKNQLFNIAEFPLFKLIRDIVDEPLSPSPSDIQEMINVYLKKVFT